MSTENTNFRFTAGEETPYTGHTELTEEQIEAVNEQLRDIADVPAIEIISSAAIPHDERRSRQVWPSSRRKRRRPQGPRRSTQAHHRAGRPRHRRSTRNRLPARSTLRDGLRTLQLAFREASPSRTSPARAPEKSSPARCTKPARVLNQHMH